MPKSGPDDSIVAGLQHLQVILPITHTLSRDLNLRHSLCLSYLESLSSMETSDIDTLPQGGKMYIKSQRSLLRAVFYTKHPSTSSIIQTVISIQPWSSQLSTLSSRKRNNNIIKALSIHKLRGHYKADPSLWALSIETNPKYKPPETSEIITPSQCRPSPSSPPPLVTAPQPTHRPQQPRLSRACSQSH
jgi:hypothetical protein